MPKIFYCTIFLILGSIVMMDIRECFVKTDVPIQHLEVNAVKDAIAASSFVIIQMDVVLQVKKMRKQK